MLALLMERRDFGREDAGVPIEGSDLSDTGGDGGVGVSEAAEDTDLVGGVATVGDEAVVSGDMSDNADSGRRISAANGDGFLMCRLCMASACRSFSWLISASTFRSDSSSRSLCASILNASRSCSPTLISSSSMTPRSMATLYLDSKSSSDEVVLRACLSKSSLATSMSRSLSCIVLLVSRSVVISFCKVFCAVFASAFDCLHLAYRRTVNSLSF